LCVKLFGSNLCVDGNMEMNEVCWPGFHVISQLYGSTSSLKSSVSSLTSRKF